MEPSATYLILNDLKQALNIIKRLKNHEPIPLKNQVDLEIKSNVFLREHFCSTSGKQGDLGFFKATIPSGYCEETPGLLPRSPAYIQVAAFAPEDSRACSNYLPALNDTWG